MKNRLMISALASAVILIPGQSNASAGEQVSKTPSRNITLEEPVAGDHPPEAEHSFVKYLRRYVPAQSSDGTLLESVSYNDPEGNLLDTRPVAKPLVNAFLFGPVDVPEPEGDENAGGFPGHGKRDVFGAVSFDDGQTWKTTNLSESADKFSTVMEDYPGDVTNIAMSVAGDRIIVAWQSRYCSTGAPGYTADTEGDGGTGYGRDAALLEATLGVDPDKDLYTRDVFGVAGSQGSVDYTEEGYPTIGELPFNCLWTVRGSLLDGDDPRTEEVAEASHIVWYKPERLTSGRRDVNRIEVAMVAGAGVTILWQEDPDGLASGQGEGPGEGWSGAIAGHQTDVWYSFLPWDHFETVIQEDGSTASLADYWALDTAKPKPFVPFAVPMRLTNNARCNTENASALYCSHTATEYGLRDQCADRVSIPTGSNDSMTEICVSENGIPNVANTAATRARMNLEARKNAEGETVGAWVIVVTEESKGLGSFGYQVDDPTVACDDPDNDDNCAIADIGKNIWYHSFEMGSPATSADTSESGLVKNLLGQGNLLNQPETNWRTGNLLPPVYTADMWNFVSAEGTDYNFPIMRTEIARRGSLLVQPVSTALASGAQLLAMPMYKQGLLQQGGPADIMARRLVYTGETTNPYDFSNIVCESRLFNDGSNPYYPKGVCLSPALNLSSVTPKDCIAAGDGDNDISDGICPSLTEEGTASTDPEDQTTFDKVDSWIQCPGSVECGQEGSPSLAFGDNIDDQSWHNPLDVAKGHRGYIWGDMVVAMYAWSPNWKRNTKGHDRYELYIRRSFDGGRSWTTTPASWGGKGTRTCEFMRDGETANDAEQVCTDYAPGAPEQSRNISQLQNADGNPTYKLTILDPRYAPSPPTMPSIIDEEFGHDDFDLFNPSRFFVVYETGDNETTAEGEAEALDLFFGRAVNFGDQYQVTSSEADMSDNCITTFCNEFERLTTGSDVSAEEASLAMSPSGNTLYAVWAQFDTGELEEGDNLADAHFARVWYDDVSPEVTTQNSEFVSEQVMGTLGMGTPVEFDIPETSPGSDDEDQAPGAGDDAIDGTPSSNPADAARNSSDGKTKFEEFFGCSASRAGAPFDPVFPLIVIMSLAYFAQRSIQTVGVKHD